MQKNIFKIVERLNFHCCRQNEIQAGVGAGSMQQIPQSKEAIATFMPSTSTISQQQQPQQQQQQQQQIKISIKDQQLQQQQQQQQRQHHYQQQQQQQQRLQYQASYNNQMAITNNQPNHHQFLTQKSEDPMLNQIKVERDVMLSQSLAPTERLVSADPAELPMPIVPEEPVKETVAAGTQKTAEKMRKDEGKLRNENFPNLTQLFCSKIWEKWLPYLRFFMPTLNIQS